MVFYICLYVQRLQILLVSPVFFKQLKNTHREEENAKLITDDDSSKKNLEKEQKKNRKKTLQI